MTLPFWIAAEPEALTITPSTPPEKDIILSHPALTSHPNDNVPSKEALSLTDEPEPEVILTPQDIVPDIWAFKETRGKAGKAKVNILTLLLQLPWSETPVFPIVVVPNLELIINSFIGFPFLTPTWYWTGTVCPNTSYFPISKVLSADIVYPNLLSFSVLFLFIRKSCSISIYSSSVLNVFGISLDESISISSVL